MLSYFFTPSTFFFDLLDKHASITYQAALKLHESLSEKIEAVTLAEIKSLEHEADSIAKQGLETLHKTFMTPIDRDQIYLLVSRIDDVVDSIDASADCLIIYKIQTPTQELIHLTQILIQAVYQMQKAVNGLRYLKKKEVIRTACSAINFFEHDADDTLQRAVGNLFQNEPDIRQLIIWKEIYETLESATDRCSDVADTLEGILLEND